jgi:hypothetical protein
MIESADQRPWQLFVYGLCLLLVTACVSNDGVRAKRRDAGGVNDRAVIGGSDKTMVGPVIAQYMDDQARELQVLAETLRTGDGIIVTLPERLLFKLNSGALDPHSRHVLLKISAIITKYDKTHRQGGGRCVRQIGDPTVTHSHHGHGFRQAYRRQ